MAGLNPGGISPSNIGITRGDGWMTLLAKYIKLLCLHAEKLKCHVILEVGVTSRAQIRHIVLGCLASFSLFIMFNLCACNVCENRHIITKFSEST